ncbi:MAG: hypothetical protein RB289_02330 [Paludibacter sp.]|jgi:hypothetical protein|nr:hypothetical protein [Paludibacter sp.]
MANLYLSGNLWQRKAYAFLSEYLDIKGIREFGVSGSGNSYRHLLRVEDGEKNFISRELYDLTLERFGSHKAGDLNRILTNTASSQAYCFNLFLYLNRHKALAHSLFSQLLGKMVVVEHIELEFTPNQMQGDPFSESATPSGALTKRADESIGDQSTFGGTDADVAVFYSYIDDIEGFTSSETLNRKKGVLLIEFKFIEAEFSVCSSFKKKQEVRAYCSGPDYYRELVTNQRTDSRQQPLCGYTRYQNWPLTTQSAMLDIKRVKQSAVCPFRFGLNQLWRNMLLAERVAEVRGCDEFGFWVLSPQPNDAYLWKQKGVDVEQFFREILTDKGNQHFRKVHLEEVFAVLESIIETEEDKAWMSGLKEKYVIG